MEYSEFCEKMVTYVRKMVNEADCNVKLSRVQKNNGVEYVGISIIDRSRRIGPTIYLESLYEDYKKGASLEKVSAKLSDIYENHRKVELDVPWDFYFDFNMVKERLIFKLVNYEKNKAMLEDMPHRRILDLAMVFCCVVSVENQGGSTITVRNSHLDMWKVDADTVYEMAVNNTPIIMPYRLGRIEDIVGISPEQVNSTGIMEVLSNSRSLFGASAMIYDDVLYETALRKNSDLYILPSSIHEVIIIATKDYDDLQALKEMVVAVNEDSVEPEDVLSDNVYIYDKESQTINLA
ncbi:MAG: DUF5688 family protein [Lachnospiraceae bacterium]